MVVAEFKTTGSTVRIHDEYCEPSADRCISRLSQIISDSYKRRQLSGGAGERSAAAAAANAAVNVREV